MSLKFERKQKIAAVDRSSCQLQSLIFWEGLWVCIKKPLPFRLLLIQGSWVHPEKLFETNAFPKLSTGMYVTQSSLPRLFFEGIRMPATDNKPFAYELTLFAVKLHWFSQYCNVLVTLGKNSLYKSITTYSASITRQEKRTTLQVLGERLS